MNQRIQELIEQAAKQYYADTGELKPDAMMYIFAELIVKECARVASDYDGAHYVGDAIEKHFGVE